MIWIVASQLMGFCKRAEHEKDAVAPAAPTGSAEDLFGEKTHTQEGGLIIIIIPTQEERKFELLAKGGRG